MKFQFRWEKHSPQRYSAGVGPFWISIRRFGPKGSYGWMVDEIFGARPYSSRVENFDQPEPAMRHAERSALEMVHALYALLPQQTKTATVSRARLTATQARVLDYAIRKQGFYARGAEVTAARHLAHMGYVTLTGYPGSWYVLPTSTGLSLALSPSP